MTNVALSCTCGKVRGTARDVDPAYGNHIVCMCDDCQTYAHHLGRAEDIARSVAFLIADDADFITGTTLSVNGGQHMY